MKYLAKLNLPLLPAPSGNDTVRERVAGMSKFSDTPQITALVTPSSLRNAVKNMLPDGLAEVIGGVSYLRVKTGYPHTHVNVGDTAINWYITAGGEEVVFYEGAVKDITAEYMLDVNHGYVLADPKYLSPVETIVPQPGDVWMLDVSQPHAVIFSPEETDYLKRYRGAADGGRLMLHVTFNIPFSKARDIMQGAGKIL